MKISGWIIIVLLIGGVIVTGFSIISEMGAANAHNITFTDEYSQKYDKINESLEIVDHTSGSIQNISADKDAGFFSGVWDGLKITKEVVIGTVSLSKSSVGVGGELITEGSKDLGFGNLVVGILLGILTVGLLFMVIEYLTKVKG